MNFDFEITINSNDLTVKVINFIPGHPAKIRNRPEDSEPPKDAEFDFLVYLDDEDITDNLIQFEIDRIVEKIVDIGLDYIQGQIEDEIERKYEDNKIEKMIEEYNNIR